MSLMGMLTKRRARTESIDYMKQVKEALIVFAEINGVLPNADTDGDGTPDGTAPAGTVPYITIGVQPKDSWMRYLKYEINASLFSDRTTSCFKLRASLGTDLPQVVDFDADPATGAFSVAAILISSGPADADNDGDVFDDVTAGSYQGDNTDGTPNYIRHSPRNDFDDLVLYIGGGELFQAIGCGQCAVSVTNNSGSEVFIHDTTKGTCVGRVPTGATVGFQVKYNDSIEIMDNIDYSSGSHVTSTPDTPLTINAATGITAP